MVLFVFRPLCSLIPSHNPMRGRARGICEGECESLATEVCPKDFYKSIPFELSPWSMSPVEACFRVTPLLRTYAALMHNPCTSTALPKLGHPVLPFFFSLLGQECKRGTPCAVHALCKKYAIGLVVPVGDRGNQCVPIHRTAQIPT